jgi:hypothetical protein
LIGRKIAEIESNFDVKVVLPKFEDDDVVNIYGDDINGVQDALTFIFTLIQDTPKPNNNFNNNNNNNNNRNNRSEGIVLLLLLLSYLIYLQNYSSYDTIKLTINPS